MGQLTYRSSTKSRLFFLLGKGARTTGLLWLFASGPAICLAQLDTREATEPPANLPAAISENKVSEPCPGCETLLLPAGTFVVLGSAKEVSSQSARPGQRFALKVLQDVAIRGQVVIAKGADAWGEVVDIQKARRLGRSGRIEISLQNVTSVTGREVQLRSAVESKGHGKMWNTMGVAVAESQGVLLPVTPLFLLMHGGEGILPKGTRVTGYVAEDIQLDALELAKFQPLRPDPLRPGYATVYVFSPKGKHGGMGAVYCGKIQIAFAEKGKYFKVQLRPGRYGFHVYAEDPGFVSELSDGDEHYIRVVNDPEWNRPHLAPALQGEFELLAGDLRPLNPKDVKDPARADLSKLAYLPKRLRQ